MEQPFAIDGSDGELALRRVVVWRRLEPGDARTPGTEIAPETDHVEAKVVTVGIALDLREDLERLWAERDAISAPARSWTTRYEPAGVLFALGGGMAVGEWLDYLPEELLPLAGSLVVLGVAVGLFTRARKHRAERLAADAWRKTEARDELLAIERRLTPRWAQFASRLREEQGFRTDLRVGDVHEAERLVSLDVARLSHPDTWRADGADDEVRYGWAYRDGRIVEQVAVLEDAGEGESEAASESVSASEAESEAEAEVEAEVEADAASEVGRGEEE